MSTSHLHTIVIKDTDDKPSQKQLEVNVDERNTEPCLRQILIIQLKDVSSCQIGIVKDDLSDINACEPDQQNQNNPPTMRKYVSLNRGRAEASLRNLVENKDRMLDNYVQRLLEHNVQLNEVDLPRKQLLYEVLLKGEVDIGDIMDMCLTPFKFWVVEESKPSGFKLSSQTLYDGVGNNSELHQEVVLFSSDSKSNRKEYYTETSSTTDEQERRFDSESFVLDKKFFYQKSQSAKAALKEKARKRPEQRDPISSEDLTKFSSQENGSIDNDLPVIDPSKVGKDTDVSERTTQKAPAEKSSEKRLAELNLRNVERFMNMERSEYIIEGSEQQEHENERTYINDGDRTATLIVMMDLLLKQAICGQSEAIQRFKEVYVNVLSDMSAYYKYHYYVESTPKELILLLVAGLKGGKGSKYARQLFLEYTQLNRGRSAESCRTDAHSKRYRNEKSKKWEGRSQIKDSDKSGRESPEGGYENGVVPTKYNKGTVEVTDGEFKGKEMWKWTGDDSQSPFFKPDDTPDTDGSSVEQRNSNTQPSHHGNMASPNISFSEIYGGRGQHGDFNLDTGDPSDDSSLHSDVDLNGNESTEVGDDEDYDSDSSDTMDYQNSYPGVRTRPEGSHAYSRSGGSMGASGGEQTTDRYKSFLKSWNINLGDNGEQCLCSALQDCESEQNLAPSTMFLLDLSKSMNHDDKITQMKAEVQSILQEAGSKQFRSEMSETYGVAVFGHKTEVLLYPTVDLHRVQETIELPRFNERDGRSPLGLGLLLCTCVWFSEKGTGGAVWLHGRKIKPRIIVITDMKMNEIARRAGIVQETGETEEDKFEPESDQIIEVKNELIQIALKLQKIGIPVNVVPIGDVRQVRSHLEGAIIMTGGKIIDKNGGQLGRQTWQQIMACNILKMIATDWGHLSEENYQLMMTTYTGDNPGDMETIQRIIAARQSQEREEENIRLLIQQTGEPGEQIWSEFPLGERVRGEPDISCTGTVIGHLPEKKIMVQWDDSPTGELESREMTGLSRGTPRDCGEYFGETHLVGSRVRKICHSDGAAGGTPPSIMDNTGVGTVLTLSAIQPSVVYVAWRGDHIRRHSTYDICRIQEQDPDYQFDHYWLFCDNGQWQPFPRDVSKIIETKRQRNPTGKTLLITLHEQQYRLSFLRNLMCSTHHKNVSYLIHRQAMIPP